jgi:(p)ppGpp synthase/HD superfamily hydrolase
MRYDVKLVLAAATFAAQAHKAQKRKYSGEPYINHPIRVAHTLSELLFPSETVAAALLHDTVEDCGVLIGEIEAKFGSRVAYLVNYVTDAAKKEDGNREVRMGINRDHIANGDFDSKSIKLSDCIDNLSSIIVEDPGFARSTYVREKKLLLPFLAQGHQVLYDRVDKIITDAVRSLDIKELH